MGIVEQVRKWQESARHVLSINHRNLGYVYGYNERRDFVYADDKVLAKELLSKAGVPVPQTYFLVESFYAVGQIDKPLGKLDDFVIKPAQGRGGGGIMVIVGKGDNGWKSASNKHIARDTIKRHVADIVFGNHSFDKSDVAVFEERLIAAELMQELSPWGIPDVRIIAFKDQLKMAMCRIPTESSGGRANLHQGALAIGLDLKTGRSTHAIHKNRPIAHHPDHGKPLIGLDIPYWDQVIEIARLCAENTPLKYLGVDIAITVDGPRVLEVNARPGLAIQLANDQGLYSLLLNARGEAL
jgi:alpha-L-glutamate ligase-like protein